MARSRTSNDDTGILMLSISWLCSLLGQLLPLGGSPSWEQFQAYIPPSSGAMEREFYGISLAWGTDMSQKQSVWPGDWYMLIGGSWVTSPPLELNR